MKIKLKGETVNLIVRDEVGRDPFNRPIYQERTISVENVLYSPTSATDQIDTLNLTGRKAVYTLSIPKGDQNIWEDQIVEIKGIRYHVFTKPKESIESLVPLAWNKTVMVESYE